MATIKQKKALTEIVENSSSSNPKGLGTILKNVGYSKATAIKPSQVTRSKGFKELVEELGIDDKKLIQVLYDGLEAKKVVTSHTEPDREYPDHPTRHRFLETGLKIKGHLNEAPQSNTVIIPIYGGLSAKPDEVPLPRHISN